MGPFTRLVHHEGLPSTLTAKMGKFDERCLINK